MKHTYRSLAKELNVTVKTLQDRKKKLGILNWDDKSISFLINDFKKTPPKQNITKKTEVEKLRNNVVGAEGLHNQLQEKINEQSKVIDAIKTAYGLLPSPKDILERQEEHNKLLKEVEHLRNYKNASIFKKIFKKW